MRLLQRLSRWRVATTTLVLWAVGLIMVAVGGLYPSTVRPHDSPPGYPWRGVLFSAVVVTLQVLTLAAILRPLRRQQHISQYGVALIVFTLVTFINYFVRVAVWDDPGFITTLFDWALIVDAALLILFFVAILEWRSGSTLNGRGHR